jgi:hypothetical protein
MMTTQEPNTAEIHAALRRPRVPVFQARTAHGRHRRWDGPAVYHSPEKKARLPRPPAAIYAARNPRDCRRPYRSEVDAAVMGGGVAFSMTIRQEVVHTATFPSSLLTTWPAARRQIGWMLPRFEGQSMTISR